MKLRKVIGGTQSLFADNENLPQVVVITAWNFRQIFSICQMLGDVRPPANSMAKSIMEVNREHMHIFNGSLNYF